MIQVWKDIRKSYSVSSFITLILGIVLLVWPDLSGTLMCYMLGGALILMGATQLLIYIKGNKQELSGRFKMMMGIVLALLGVWICAKPEIVLGLIPAVLGIVLLMHAVQDLSYTIQIKNSGVERWWVALIATLITFVLAVFLIIHPFLAFEIAMIYIGIGLIYNGISDLVLVILAAYCKRKSDKQIRELAGVVQIEDITKDSSKD